MCVQYTHHTPWVWVCLTGCLSACANALVSVWQIGQHSQLCETDINKTIWNIVEFKGKFMGKCQALLLQIEINNGNSISPTDTYSRTNTHTHARIQCHAILYDEKKEQRLTLRTTADQVNRKWIELNESSKPIRTPDRRCSSKCVYMYVDVLCLCVCVCQREFIRYFRNCFDAKERELMVVLKSCTVHTANTVRCGIKEG